MEVIEEQGFSLIEVIVAFAITSLYFVVILPATNTSLDRLLNLESRSKALAIAESQLVRHTSLALFKNGSYTGIQGEYSWKVEITNKKVSGDGQFILRHVTVDVRKDVDDSSIITLSTSRIGYAL